MSVFPVTQEVGASLQQDASFGQENHKSVYMISIWHTPSMFQLLSALLG